MGRGAAGRAEKLARNAAQLSRSYSKLAYRLTSFRLDCTVDDVLRCRDRAGSFPEHPVHVRYDVRNMRVHVRDLREL